MSPTPAPPPWAGQSDPAAGLRARTTGPRPPVPVPPGTVVHAIPSALAHRQSGIMPFRAEGADALARVRDALTAITADPTAPLHDVAALLSWAKRAGWYVVVTAPDGTTREADPDARRAFTSPFWHDPAALLLADDADTVRERVRAERRAARAGRPHYVP